VRTRPFALFLLAALAVFAGPASAHIAQVPYNLPVPFWMYAYGATGALVASFVVVGYFVRADTGARNHGVLDISDTMIGRAIGAPLTLAVMRGLSVFALGLSIVTGFFGSTQADSNFNITFFWIVFALGFTYLTMFIGDLYAVVNPWLVVCEWIEGARKRAVAPRRHYPTWLGYYPALMIYLAFIWFELFGHPTPRSLAIALLLYTALNVYAAWLFGKAAWFHYGELFAVFLRLIAMVAPVEILPPVAPGGRMRLRLRVPFAGLTGVRPDHFSLVVFVLFMLSSTAFDGIHETVAWAAIFWKGIYPVLATFVATKNPRQYLVLVHAFYYWQWLMLFLSPLIYLAMYSGFVFLTRVVTRTDRSLHDLALDFAYSLIPIAIVYNISHYFTLLVGQGPAIASLISDPFGLGWNLFGTRDLGWQGMLIDAGIVWHGQVWVILIGHIVSVYLSHIEALRIFRTSRQATVSQIPLLLLMVALTTVGLWILSMPIASGQVMLPPPANL
jgi:hypothetical protein